MKLSSAISLAAAALATTVRSMVPGFDISHFQRTVNFGKAFTEGARFVIIKATEGTSFIDGKFSEHYTGATSAGLIRGGYHFARPSQSSGGAQARFFLEHGGGWSNDGVTLPGMLDIEYNPSGSTCYGLSPAAMVSWVSDFVETYHSSTGRYPLIYTTTNWWKQCTGNSAAFGNKCPLVIARYSNSVGELPNGWGSYTIWQNNDHSPWGGDSDSFNGDISQLKRIATG